MRKLFKRALAIVLCVLIATSTLIISSASSYSADYKYWSQGAADYYKMKKYGCWVVSQARMIYESGVNDNASFNPDVYLSWQQKNGYINNGFYQTNGTYAPVAYAKSIGDNNLIFLGTTYKNIKNKILENISNGYYSILKVTANSYHYTMVANEESIAHNEIWIYDTSSSKKTFAPKKLNYTGLLELYTYKYDAPIVRNYSNDNKIMKTDEVNVLERSGPGKKYRVVKTYPNIGTKIKVVGYGYNEYGNKWYKTENGNWIFEERLDNLSMFSITYNGKGGAGVPKNQAKVQDEIITLSGVYPTKKGCQFLGWSTNKNVKSIYTDDEEAVAQVKYQPGAQYTANKKLNLYAVWLETKTTLNLSKNNVTLCLNDNNTAKITATVQGRVNADYSIEVSTAENVTSKTSELDVTFKTKFGTIGQLMNNKGTATITLTGKQKGSSIIYVNVKDNNGKVVAKSGISLNVTEKYSVTYDANGGSGAPKSQTKTSGKNLQLSSNVPTKSGYSFMGWATPDSGGKVVYGPGDLYKNESNIKLTAVWGADYFIEPVVSADGKTLTIRGNGDMPNYGANTYTTSKWNKYASTVETINFEAIDGGRITSIGSYAFANFKKLTSVVIPITVSRIYSYAFYGCTSLRTVTAPADIVLGSYAFANCGKLSSYNKTSKTARNSVAASSVNEAAGTIGAFAFENCVNLQSIDVSNATSIGEGAFSGCMSLSDVKLSASLECIEDSTFYNCTDLTEINIPESVTEISEGAFSGCSALDEIELPDNIETLGDQAFSGCSAITEVDIPDSVECIGSSVFSNCTSLSQVDLPEDINVLGDSMFAGCTSLEHISIPEETVDVGNGTFFGCTSLSQVNLSKSINRIGDNTFAYCKSLENIDIPESVTTIDGFAFFGCESLTNVDLPSGLKEIGSCAFGECTSLQEIVLPESIELIDEGAFMNCTSLSKVEIPESMLSIKDEAFACCTALKNVTIPESAEYVSDRAFVDCVNEMTINCYSTSSIYSELMSSSVDYNTIYPVQSFELKQSALKLEAGQTRTLEGVFTPTNATNKAIIWESQNEDVAVVSDTGVVKGVGSGTATVVAMTVEGDFVSTCEVECTVPVKDIVLEDVSSSYFVGTDFMISYSFNPASPSNIDVSFSSSDTNVATVSSEGIVSVIGKGSAVITVSTPDGKVSKSFKITGEEYIPAERLELNINSLNLKVNEETQLIVGVYPQNSSAKDLVCYMSENELVATVDDFGLVKAVGVGETSIVCFVDDVEVRCVVTVLAKTPQVSSVSISDISMNYKDSENIIPIINADSDSDYTITYSSSDPSVVYVDEFGEVYAAGEGSAEITCTVTDEYGNVVTDTCEVKVSYAWWQWIIRILLLGFLWY